MFIDTYLLTFSAAGFAYYCPLHHCGLVVTSHTHKRCQPKRGWGLDRMSLCGGRVQWLSIDFPYDGLSYYCTILGFYNAVIS